MDREPMFSGKMENTQVNTADPAIEKSIIDYIEYCIAVKKEDYTPSIRPFSSIADETRREVDSSLHDFFNSFMTGQKILIEFLKKTDSHAEDLFTLSDEKLALVNDVEYVKNALDDGKTLHQILGLSQEALGKLYIAACDLYEAQEYQKAKYAFYFLTCLTPSMQQFWLGLGLSQCKLQDYDSAIKTLQFAISLDPSNATSYLACIHTLSCIHDFEQAKQLCDSAVAYAQEHHAEPWSEELSSMLQEAKEYLISQASANHTEEK